MPSRFYLDKFAEWGFPTEKFRHVPNFVDVARYAVQPSPGKAFLYVGRLSREKGLATLIAAAHAARCPLKLAGTGPDLEKLRALSARLGADVTFLGYLNADALHAAIRESRAVVLASECYENAPMSVLEAYALGKPVIGARIGGIPELILENETGVSFESGNVQALEAALRHMSGAADSHIEALGRRGREWVEQNFSAEVYRQRVLAVYAEAGRRAHRGVRVMALGIRGIPGVQGGVETHAEQLYQRLSRLGCSIDVIVRTPYVPRELQSFGAIRLRRVWSPRRSGFEAIVHSLLGVLYAGIARPDILHIHAVGPAIVTPLARLLGLRVVVTHHGPDYDRDKWGSFARAILRTGESWGMRCSHARIAISKLIVELIRAKYDRPAELIPNGVVTAEPASSTEHLQGFGLQSGRYLLQVSRMVPEKRQLDLIAAYAAAAVPGWKLALTGELDASDYSRRVQAAAESSGVVLTGFQSGEALRQLYSHAGGFVLPSSHEGLPIAMLEALSYGVPVLASDIPANLEVGLADACYFPLGDSAALGKLIRSLVEREADEPARAARRQWVTEKYDWDRIAAQTLEVYERAARTSSNR